jgi:beta-glucanase (GH16 family)
MEHIVRLRPLFFILVLAFLSRSWPQDSSWTLVWSDEFNAHHLDTAFWNYDVGTGDNGWGNNELQYYTPGNNVMFNDSCLVIELRRETMGGAQYTSGRINTRKKVQYMFGKIQARIKAPYSQAVWPAFWTLGANYEQVDWPTCGEADIFEMACGDYYPDNRGDNTNFGIARFASDGGSLIEEKGYVTLRRKMSDDFHVFTLVWSQDSVKFYLDSATTPYFDTTIANASRDAFRQPHSLVINMALGGTGFAGMPDATTVLPQRLQVDWVRWYQKKTGVMGATNGNKAKGRELLRSMPRGVIIKLTRPDESSLKIYRCDGRLVADLTKDIRGMTAGVHRVPLFGLDKPAGTYVVCLTEGNRTVTSRITMLP